MKSSIAILFLSFFALFACQKSEQTTPPDVVKNAFSTKFPAAKSVKWSMEAQQEYEAEFKMNGHDMSANFDAGGAWMETETEIAVADLPAAVRQAIVTQFPDYTTEEAESAETPEGLTYEVELKKGDAEMEVVFNPDGQMLKQEMDSEDQKEEGGS